MTGFARWVFRLVISRLAQPTGSKPGMFLHPKGEFISDQIRTTGRHYEIEKLTWVKRNLDYSHFIDIGANIGNHSHFFLSLGASVHAFEPSEENFKLLAANCPGALCHKVAIAKTEGTATLITFPGAMGNSRLSDTQLSAERTEQVLSAPEQVQTKPLDSFHFDNATLVKIDVEGSELSVLEGAERVLESHRPALWIEIHKNTVSEGGVKTNPRSSTIEFLSERGYVLRKVMGRVDYVFLPQERLSRVSGLRNLRRTRNGKSEG